MNPMSAKYYQLSSHNDNRLESTSGRSRFIFILFCISVLLLPATSWRLGLFSYFDLIMIAFVMVAGTLSIKNIGSSFHLVPLAFVAFSIQIVAIAISMTQSLDQLSHFSRSVVPSLAILVMWIFIALATSFLQRAPENAWLALCMSLTVGSFSVFLDGFSRGGGVILESVDRQLGWMQHPIEAGYLAAYGAVLSVWFFVNNKRWIFVVPIVINIYSLRYSASMTAIFSLLIALIYMTIALRSVSFFSIIAAFSFFTLIISPDLTDTFIIRRISDFLTVGVGYDTVSSRIAQNELVLSKIDGFDLFLGNGFSDKDISMIGGLEIHNSFLGALYHFGILGTTSQLLLILLIVRPLLSNAVCRKRKILVVAALIVFFGPFLTGPSMARRSLWFPVAFLAISSSSSRSILGINQKGELAAFGSSGTGLGRIGNFRVK